MQRALILQFALICAGCASQLRELRGQSELSNEVGAFVLKYSDADEEVVPRIKMALNASAPALRRWGTLRERVTVEIVPNHQLLEEATHHPGYGWLRAWARYDEVFLQSPRTWGSITPTQSELNELISHELTHCLVYQLSSDRSSWSKKEFPLWFREGIASFTAGQSYRWPSLSELARFLREHPDIDLINHPESVYKSESDMVYSAAHHAFTFLVKRYGEPAVRQILVGMRDGPTFSESFKNVTGTDVSAFAAEFQNLVRQRAQAAQLDSRRQRE
jgi:hypothetical protein